MPQRLFSCSDIFHHCNALLAGSQEHLTEKIAERSEHCCWTCAQFSYLQHFSSCNFIMFFLLHPKHLLPFDFVILSFNVWLDIHILNCMFTMKSCNMCVKVREMVCVCVCVCVYTCEFVFMCYRVFCCWICLWHVCECWEYVLLTMWLSGSLCVWIIPVHLLCWCSNQFEVC